MTESQNNSHYLRLRSTQLIISKLEAYSQTLDDRITQLNSQYKSLILEQRQLETFKISHQYLIAPVRRLLPEILQQIFSFCLPESRNAAMSKREAPLLLGQICSEWRQIAYSTPELWSSIHIVVPPVLWDPYLDQYALGPPIHIISEWLSRSGIRPLSISMQSTSNLRTSARMDIKTHKYMESIIPFSRRWRSLKLNLGRYNWDEMFSRLSRADVPILEELYIGGIFRDFRIATDPDYSQIKRNQSIICAPHLHRISLPAFSGEIIHFPIDWQHLTSLDLHYGADITLIQIVETLSRCPNIETCSIPCQKSQEESLSIPPGIFESKSILLPKLFSLRFLCQFNKSPDGYLTPLLRILHTPNLRHLSFGDSLPGYLGLSNNAGDFFNHVLPSFKARLVQPLEELRLEVYAWSTVEVVGILKVFPEMKRLSLEILPIDNPRTRQLVYRRGRGGYSRSRRRDIAQFVWDDEQLEKFMVNRDNRGRTTGKEGDHQDDILPPPSTNMDTETSHDKHEYLCPNLEVLHCTGADFSTDILFKFLRFRRSSIGTHLQKASISFNPGYMPSMSLPLFRKGIEKIEEETGVILEVILPSDSLRREYWNPQAGKPKAHSSYNGLQNETSVWMRTRWSGNTKLPAYFGFLS